MRHDRSGALRSEEHQRDHDEIFARLHLTWRERPILGQAALHRRIVGMVEIGPVEPQDEPHREEGEAEADPRPLEGVGRRRVSDRRLIGPILGPRRVRLIRAPCHGGHRRIDDEVGGLDAQRGIEALRRNPAGREIDRIELGRKLALQAANALRDRVRKHDPGLREIDPLKLLLHGRRNCRVGECLSGRTLRETSAAAAAFRQGRWLPAIWLPGAWCSAAWRRNSQGFAW